MGTQYIGGLVGSSTGLDTVAKITNFPHLQGIKSWSSSPHNTDGNLDN